MTLDREKSGESAGEGIGPELRKALLRGNSKAHLRNEMRIDTVNRNVHLL